MEELFAKLTDKATEVGARNESSVFNRCMGVFIVCESKSSKSKHM